jgi:hypothetical protein
VIVETALRLAGQGSRLVARPTGVAHVYTGPLTPSGRFVPRNRRTVCRAHTRRLAVLPVERTSTLVHHGSTLPRLCARCSACLAPGETRQAEPTSRDDFRAVYADTSPFELVVAARMAETPDELAAVGHLSLVLFGHRGCLQPVVRRDGRRSAPLHTHIAWHRQRVLGFPKHHDTAAFFRGLAAANDVRREQAREARELDEELIGRIGIRNAKPRPVNTRKEPRR